MADDNSSTRQADPLGHLIMRAWKWRAAQTPGEFPEPVPPEQWTTWQRERMTDWYRDERRKRWAPCIERWEEYQLDARRWIRLSNIAEELSRPPGDALPDDNRRGRAYVELLNALDGGEFQRADGRSGALLLHRFGAMLRMNSDALRRMRETHSHQTFVDEYLGHTWIPVAMAHAFFAQRGQKFPPLLEPGQQSSAKRNAGKPRIAEAVQRYLAEDSCPSQSGAVEYVKRKFPGATRARIRQAYAQAIPARRTRGRPSKRKTIRRNSPQE